MEDVNVYGDENTTETAPAEDAPLEGEVGGGESA